MRDRINVALFSGGSGTHTITEALWHHPEIRLQILINAYDDGHSTGRLRRFIRSMLGPSDVRKNVSRLMPCPKILDARLPVGVARTEALRLLEAMLTGERDEIRALLAAFVAYIHQQETLGRTFDFTDCAVGNLLFAGCYLQSNCDFNRAIAAFSRACEVPDDALLNITQGENLFLIAEKEAGGMLLTEAEIAAAQVQAKIAELYLIDAPEPATGRASRTPRINPTAAAALAQADVIVYGPGTQHSSLFPSYMTEGVAEAIAANREAQKILIANLDTRGDELADLARKFMRAMTRKNTVSVEWHDCVTHFLVQQSGSHAPLDPSLRVRNWEASEGHHSGPLVLEEILHARARAERA
jgi:2-phospho-L-lactate transferase/gluconeogenesis factor (CofD/UPF0052 family)